LTALKARLPDAAFARFLLSMQDVGDAFEKLVRTADPPAGVEVLGRVMLGAAGPGV
jgi:hypothetical protein